MSQQAMDVFIVGFTSYKELKENGWSHNFFILHSEIFKIVW